MKQEHKEVLKAWIDGKHIQFEICENKWGDMADFDDCYGVYFDDDIKLRIKPEVIVSQTYIEYNRDDNSPWSCHTTYTNPDARSPNLRLTWEEGQLIKAEVI